MLDKTSWKKVFGAALSVSALKESAADGMLVSVDARKVPGLSSYMGSVSHKVTLYVTSGSIKVARGSEEEVTHEGESITLLSGDYWFEISEVGCEFIQVMFLPPRS